jgi:hypothetical protein
MDSSGDSHQLTGDDIAEALRAARERDVAPPRLHAQIRAMHKQRARRPAWRGRGIYAATWATGIALVVALVILIAPAGTPGTPSLAQAVALSTRGPARDAKALGPAAGSRGALDVNIDGISFPDWSDAYSGWRAVGWRSDMINGRTAVTVYYVGTKTNRRIAYTIVGGTKIPWPHVPVVVEGGLRLRTLTLAGKRVTTWRRGDNTCVLSGVGVPGRVLQDLAARN